MKAVTASTRVLVSGGGDCWKVAEPRDPPHTVKERTVRLEIVGDDQNGYHLNMSPDGCFTADTWHATMAEALDTAKRLFNVDRSAWG
jgi:hypothetical protein